MKNPDWAAAAARLRAYASPSVLDAKRAADDADRTVISRFLDWQGATETNRNAIERARLGVPADIPDGHVAMEALQAVRQAADAASAADEALRAAIWDDMHTRPSLRQNAPRQNALPGAERPQLPPA
jgi:hypothetical protein